MQLTHLALLFLASLALALPRGNRFGDSPTQGTTTTTGSATDADKLSQGAVPPASFGNGVGIYPGANLGAAPPPPASAAMPPAFRTCGTPKSCDLGGCNGVHWRAAGGLAACTVNSHACVCVAGAGTGST